MEQTRSTRFVASTAAGVALLLVLVACGGPGVETTVAPPTPAAPVVQDVALTNQEASLQDLRGCLAINPVLNVFYLIDDSGSLEDTDPDRLRAQILADSLASLSNLNTSISVNWAAGVFTSYYTPLRDWSALQSADEAQLLKELIPQTNPRSLTNWEAAVEGARGSLNAQSRNQPGCSMLIWFTDGLINVGDGTTGPQTIAAAERLCNGQGDSPSILQQMRTEQIVVFGVLLNRSAEGSAAAKSLIRLVEVNPDAADEVVGTCGSASSADVRGTVEVVTEAGDLAVVFDRLSVVLAGGAPGDINDSGEFRVPVGVSRFVIQLAQRTAPWQLIAPNGDVVTQGDLDWPRGIMVAQNATGTKATAEIVIDEPNVVNDFTGTWTLSDHVPGADALFRFSDLTVSLDDLKGANLGVVSGAGSTVKGIVLDRDGNPARLALYDFNWVIQERLPSEPQARELQSKTFDEDDAEFSIDLGSTAATPGDRMRVVITLSNLQTVDGGVPLEGPSASLQLTVLRPDQVPSGLRLNFPDPAGSANAPARGEIVAESFSGSAPVTVVVQQDALSEVRDRFDREFLIVPSSTGCDAGVAECGQLSSDQRTVPISIGITEDAKPQYSSVTGQLLVELIVPADADAASDQPVRVITNLPFALETERPINLVLLVGLLLFLLLIGFAVPIVVAWLLKRGLVWIQHGRLLQRAEFPIAITDGEASLTSVDLSDDAGVTSAFRNLSPNDTVRSHVDARLGTFAIRVPWNPLSAAWFALTAPVGIRIIAKQSDLPPRRSVSDTVSGKLVVTNGVLPGAWGVAIEERALKANAVSGLIAGYLVVYVQPVRGEPGQHSKRLREIIATTDWRARVRELAHAVALADATSAQPEKSVSDQTEPSTRPDRSAPGRTPSSGAPANIAPPGRSGTSATTTSSIPAEPPQPPGRPSGSGATQASRRGPSRSSSDDTQNQPPRPPGR